MQALGFDRISEDTKSTVSKTEGVLDGTWAVLSDWKNNSDQTCSFPRDLRFSASLGHN